MPRVLVDAVQRAKNAEALAQEIIFEIRNLRFSSSGK